jgi:hypothetical protein
VKQHGKKEVSRGEKGIEVCAGSCGMSQLRASMASLKGNKNNQKTLNWFHGKYSW